MSNSLCGGASFGGSSSLSKMLDLASHRAFVTGDWYIPGQRPRGFRPLDELASLLSRGEGLSKGEAYVETTGMVLEEGEEFKSMAYWNFCKTNWVFERGRRIQRESHKFVGESKFGELKKGRLLTISWKWKVNGQCSFFP